MKYIGKLGSDLAFCRCRMCRYGMRRPYGSYMLRYIRKSGRRAVKQALHMGQYERVVEYRKLSVPYLD